MSKNALKDKILDLLKRGFSYSDITKMARAHKNYVYVVASRNGLNKGRGNLQEQIVRYCENNGVEATIKKFKTTKARIATYKNRIKLK